MGPLPLVVVTGAGGFVGGHVARTVAASGRYRVHGFVRRIPEIRAGDPSIEWSIGDLRDPRSLAQALEGARYVIHCASWVRLGRDRKGRGREINVDAVHTLVKSSRDAGVERIVYTSTLHTLGSGTPDAPSDESSAWNIGSVRSPYAETKREGERIILEANSDRLQTIALCPGMVLGARDPGPTSSRVVLAMARAPIAVLPGGGIPMIDAEVLSLAHLRALERGTPGHRYATVGPYLGFRDLARIIAAICGQPRLVLDLPDWTEPPFSALAAAIDSVLGGRWAEVSRATVAGGYLRFHISGAAADRAFDLTHPDPRLTVYKTLVDARDSGRFGRPEGRKRLELLEPKL